jgi:drug/metabolite transporter (DMT)-like permease
MIWLILNIICSVIIGLIFRTYPKFGINNLQAIVVNYLVCVMCASIHNQGLIPFSSPWKEPWFWPAFGLGFFFISGFNVAAKTVQYYGITLATMMQKLSMVITIIYAIVVFKEGITLFSGLGILMALGSIILSTRFNGQIGKKTGLILLLPILTLLANAVIETSLFHLQKKGITSSGDVKFLGTIFMFAGLMGLIYWMYLNRKGESPFEIKNVAAGIFLGIPNYGSMLFLLWAVNSGLPGTVVFPLMNVGVLFVSALLAWFLFKERPKGKGLIGLILALLAIILFGIAG